MPLESGGCPVGAGTGKRHYCRQKTSNDAAALEGRQKQRRQKKGGQTVKIEEACHRPGDWEWEGEGLKPQLFRALQQNLTQLNCSAPATLPFPRQISLTFTHLLLYLQAVRLLSLNRNQPSLPQANFMNSMSSPQLGNQSFDGGNVFRIRN